MPTFAELYCARTGCSPHQFQQRIFWRTLHWYALPLAPLILISDYFASDYDLIDACSRATRMKEIYQELHERRTYPRHSNWLRRHTRLRISTRRLDRLAARYLGRPIKSTI